MLERITVNPDIHFGKPCIEGTRIPVQDVLELVAQGLSFEQIIKDYHPDITAEDIRACLRYAAALVAFEDVDSGSNETELNANLAAMREAGKDEMFLADLAEAMEDFHHLDIEGALA